MNLIEATSSTGYNKKIHDSFREGVYLTNLHSDTTSPTNEIPMQSPFTDTWVGGRQSRHVAINRYQSTFSTTNNLDSFTTRPEEWRLLIGEHEVDEVVDGALGFAGPDYGGSSYPNPDRSFAIYYRDGRAKDLSTWLTTKQQTFSKEIIVKIMKLSKQLVAWRTIK